MIQTLTNIDWLRINGPPRMIGWQLGQAGRTAVHEWLCGTSYWRWVTHPRHMDTVATIASMVKRRFPVIWQELEGLADGLELSLDQVLAWNFRGDILPGITDAATTFLLPGTQPVIAHNQDGARELRGHCFIAEIRPDEGPVFASFCLPGSLPGETFGVNGDGLVVVANGLFIHGAKATFSRLVLGRAALSCNSIETVIALIARSPECGGCHFALGQAGSRRLETIEFGYGHCRSSEISQAMVHTNHALALGLDKDHQTITPSSAARQKRGRALVDQAQSLQPDMLRDDHDPEMPIYRTALDDPDGANTLASVIFNLEHTSANWRIFAPHQSEPVHTGRIQIP